MGRAARPFEVCRGARDGPRGACRVWRNEDGTRPSAKVYRGGVAIFGKRNPHRSIKEPRRCPLGKVSIDQVS